MDVLGFCRFFLAIVSETDRSKLTLIRNDDIIVDISLIRQDWDPRLRFSDLKIRRHFLNLGELSGNRFNAVLREVPEAGGKKTVDPEPVGNIAGVYEIEL